MIRLRAADESSLSDDAVKLIIKTAIRQAHLHESIFRLLFENSLIREFVIEREYKKFSNSPIRDRKRPLLDQDLAPFKDIDARTRWLGAETTAVQRAPTSSITINP